MTSSARFIGKLPLVRLLQLLEAASPDLDSTLTATLDVMTVLRLIYIFSRLRPNTKCSHLRCKKYKQMLECFRKAGQRVKNMNNGDKLVSAVMNNGHGEITAEVVSAVSKNNGFDEAWLSEVFDKKHKGVTHRVSTRIEGLSLSTLQSSACW